MPDNADFVRRLRQQMGAVPIGESIAEVVPLHPDPTPSYEVGVMATAYIAIDERAWALQETHRVIEKLDPTTVVIFGDQFGCAVAGGLARPYRLSGCPSVPCHPQVNWVGPMEQQTMLERTMIRNAADEVYEISPASAEGMTMARQYVADNDVLVIIGGRRGRTAWPHHDIVHIDQFKKEVIRYA